MWEYREWIKGKAGTEQSVTEGKKPFLIFYTYVGFLSWRVCGY